MRRNTVLRPALVATLIALSSLAPAAGSALPTSRSAAAGFDAAIAPALPPADATVARLPLLGARPADAPLLYAEAGQATASRDSSALRNARGARGLWRNLTRRPKEVDAKTAASLIQSGDRVFVPVGQVTSGCVLGALAERAKQPASGLSPEKPVEVVGLSNVAARSVFDREGKVVPRALFLGANVRDPIAAGRGSFVPAYFGRIPRLIREGKVPVDVALIQVSPPDRLGYVTMGPTAGCAPAAVEKAKLVIAQVNANLPRTRGDTRLHLSKIDYVVKKDEPLVPVPAAEITEVDRQIAKHVVGLALAKDKDAPKPTLLKRAVGAVKRALGCGDMPTFQFGIGGIPDAVAQELAATPELKACRIRSELIGPGTRRLVESGKVKGQVTYTFGMGDESFLRWMDRNAKLVGRGVDHVNDPAKIGRIKNVVAINSALRVDLLGQVNAQYIKGEWYSGVGGQVDFMRGAMLSKNGKAIIALPSTAALSDGKGGSKLLSKIVPRLGDEDVVTTNMHDVQYVVTEHGVAALEGKTDVERARALIAVAHPQFRAELTASLDAQLAARKQAEQKRYQKFLESKQPAAAH
jgi:4-hydroxybutyrate CoA-transferase